MVSTKKRVLVDCDGVLADFLTAALHVINESERTCFKHEQVTAFDICESLGVPHCWDTLRAACASPGFVLGLEQMPEAAWHIELLRDLADVFVVTSPMSVPNWAYERGLWLERHFNFKKPSVVQTEAKHVILGDVLIDDKIENVESWAEHHPNGLGIIFQAGYNKTYSSTLKNVVRASGWPETVKQVREFLQKESE